MVSSASSPVAARVRRDNGGLIIVLVLALLGAPAVSSLRSECDLCPPNCPMHQHHAGAAPTHLGCHGGGALAARVGQRNVPTRGPLVACANCGNHGLMPGSVLPPMILPAALPSSAYAAAGAARFADAALSSRVIDPPDTPPPIGAA